MSTKGGVKYFRSIGIRVVNLDGDAIDNDNVEESLDAFESRSPA